MCLMLIPSRWRGGSWQFFRGSELGSLEEHQLISREDLVAPRRASLVLHSWLEIVAEDVVRKVIFGGGGVGVGDEVEEQHPVPMHVLDRGHGCLDLAEEDGNCLGVSSVVVGSDGVI